MHHAFLHGMGSNPTLAGCPSCSGRRASSIPCLARTDEAEVRPRFCGFAGGDAHPSMSPAFVQFWTEKLVGIVYYLDATAITWFADSPVT